MVKKKKIWELWKIGKLWKVITKGNIPLLKVTKSDGAFLSIPLIHYTKNNLKILEEGNILENNLVLLSTFQYLC